METRYALPICMTMIHRTHDKCHNIYQILIYILTKGIVIDMIPKNSIYIRNKIAKTRRNKECIIH